LLDTPWLDGPAGNTRIIGKTFFADYTRGHGLEIVQSGCRGLFADFRALSSERNDPSVVAPAVSNFYGQTSEYELDAWSAWNGLFKPFGTALALIFSRRLQQLNVPLSSLDSSRGMSSEVMQMRDPQSGEVVQTAWVRELRATKNILYAGAIPCAACRAAQVRV
jgi:hypothetical protein